MKTQAVIAFSCLLLAAPLSAQGAQAPDRQAARRAARDIVEAAAARKDGEYFPMWAGQSVGLIHDLPGAADVVRAVVDEARAVLRSLSSDVTVL